MRSTAAGKPPQPSLIYGLGAWRRTSLAAALAAVALGDGTMHPGVRTAISVLGSATEPTSAGGMFKDCVSPGAIAGAIRASFQRVWNCQIAALIVSLAVP
jgi:hypothetical protein